MRITNKPSSTRTLIDQLVDKLANSSHCPRRINKHKNPVTRTEQIQLWLLSEPFALKLSNPKFCL